MEDRDHTGKTAYRELYEEGRKRLEEKHIPDASLDARLLLEAVCGTTLQTLLVFPDKEVTAGEAEKYRTFLERRENREPTAMILGEWDFMGRTFVLNKSTLIPEQDTECLVEMALEEVRSQGRDREALQVLDLCTGSGCILLSLLHEWRSASGLGTDLSMEALKAAEENAERQGLSERAVFLQGDLWDPVAGRTFDVIVSNPPYIPTEVIPTLEPEVCCGEPYAALDGGRDGLDFYRRIMERAAEHLNPGGMILAESGFDEAAQITDLMKAGGMEKIRVRKDYGGLDRVVYGIRG